MTKEQKIIKAKLGLLELAQQLGNVSHRPIAGREAFPRSAQALLYRLATDEEAAANVNTER